jgi:enoyl-CoA hydratase/carnithine racemase
MAAGYRSAEMNAVEVEHRTEQIVDLVLNRPEARNALTKEMCISILEALERIDADSGARAVIVRGQGPAFCSGADLNAVSGPGALDFIPTLEKMLDTLARFRLPTIARIQGAALGGGLQLATSCDFRICGNDADLGIPSPRIGIVVNFENVQRLVLLVGLPGAREILMTGRTYSGPQAAAAGLVTRSVPAEALDEETERLAASIASLAPLSVQGAKQALQVMADHLGGARTSRSREAAQIDELVERAYRSADLTEGLRARAENREPRFRGS